MKYFLIILIKLYQKFYSPISKQIFLPGSCRYHPSCSEYALEAINKHGAVKGFLIAAKRFWRCQPLFKGGVDPVA